jgi:hypothetical protein
MQTNIWNKCYPSNWKGVIVEEAIVHPAKFSSRLIRRIYEHIIEEGWVKEGDTIVDPFGGVSLGALDALRLGLKWRGCELEPRFVELGNANIAFWNSKFSGMPRWSGDAVLLQGDSRNLVKVLSESGDSSVSSPPYNLPMSQAHNGSRGGKRGTTPSEEGAFVKYGNTPGQLEGLPMSDEGFDAAISSPAYGRISVEKNASRSIDWEKQYKSYKASGGGQTFEQFCATQEKHSQGYGESEGQLSAMPFTKKGYQASISSPPFLQSEGGTPEPKPGGVIDAALYARHQAGNAAAKGYGETDSNLGNMRGDEEGFRAAISSPPYAESVNQSAGANDTEARIERMRKAGIDVDRKENVGGPAGVARNPQSYGFTDGQLGAMPARADSFDASVSSPPYEGTPVAGFNSGVKDSGGLGKQFRLGNNPGGSAQVGDVGYGDTAGNIGNDSGDDFWLAARAIVEQTYAVLSPGAHAVWVVKGFVKNKQYVDFPDQWRQLCEAVGFVTLHEHRAMLVHKKGKQGTLDGGMIELKTESKSFFRRLAEKNGSPPINWETVFCMEKPL